jgi:Family of unknown function (DUF5947)
MHPSAEAGLPGLAALHSVRRFMRPRAEPERCELCGAGLAAVHHHLVEPSTRRLACACQACGILFSGRHEGARFLLVPRGVHFLPDLRLPDEAWENLQLPINLAFFLRSTPAGRVVAFYPSPAGATESLIPLEAWQALVDDNSMLSDLQSDVEALLVNRVAARPEYYRLGVDECYRLVGLIRMHWHGLSGGPAAWVEIGRFFADLKERAQGPGRPHA